MDETPPVDWDSARLKQLADLVPKDRDARRGDAAFGQLLSDLYFGSERTAIPIEVLRAFVGDPDRMITIAEGELWLYDWIDYYGPTRYHSSTPFLINNGVAIGYSGAVPSSWREA